VFPFLGSACGWKSAAEHLDYLQKYMYSSAHPEFATKPEFWTSRIDINFRVGKFGRMEWTENGVDYYRQYMPPSLQEQVASPEFLIAQMDHAGVDMAVLQNCKVYGKLNDYFAGCVKKYPGKFVATGEINEFEADKECEISKLRHIVKDLGLKAIFYEAMRFLETGNICGFIDKKFDLFWREVSDLGIAVLWNFTSSKAHMEQLRAFAEWADRFPDVQSLVSMGFCVRPFKQNGTVEYPKELFDIFQKPNVLAEVVYPIQAGPVGWEYPFPEANRLIKRQYEELGAHKLCWGSDMPNVERNCTYRQCLTHLTKHCDFIKPSDMELILGGNIARIMKIKTDIPAALRPKLADVA
jgi:predicted TIM-barrel fold metal-dependent hydrolase